MVLSSALFSVAHDSIGALSAPARAAESTFPWLWGQAERLLFWAAIALPVWYLWLLVGGIETAGELRLFLELFGLHVVALLGGRYHH